ncbi:unannotated protein [freshwater metagenome]|uniref:Unannotated protein n=1 Tax=freshwater metagenome TaxID=449393 RepID=A0A6J6HL12_9ZZZZ
MLSIKLRQGIEELKTVIAFTNWAPVVLGIAIGKPWKPPDSSCGL